MVACSPCRASFISNWLHIVPSALVRLSLCWCVCVAWRFCYLIGSQEYVINDNKLLVHYAFKKWLFHAITKSQKNTKRKFWSVYGHAQWLTSNISLLFLFIFQQTYEENTEGHQLRDFDMLMYRQILGTSNKMNIEDSIRRITTSNQTGLTAALVNRNENTHGLFHAHHARSHQQILERTQDILAKLACYS